MRAENLKKLLEEKKISQSEALGLLEAFEESPSRQQWKEFLASFSLLSAIAFCLSGIIFFFAYNWAAMGKFIKFGVLEAAILVSAIGAWKLKEGASQVSLLIAAVLVGPLLAVYGQTYQTGADTFELFLGWAALILPWVILARIISLWMVFLALLNIALVFYWKELAGSGVFFDGRALPNISLWMLNIIPWMTWELFHSKGIRWFEQRWPVRIFALLTLTPITVYILSVIVGDIPQNDSLAAPNVILGCSLFAVTFYYYRSLKKDVLMLAYAALYMIIVLTTGAGKVLASRGINDEGFFFLLAFVIIVEVGFVAAWLRRESQTLKSIKEFGHQDEI